MPTPRAKRYVTAARNIIISANEIPNPRNQRQL